MRIVMLEPLAVPVETLLKAAKPLTDAGHTFFPCTRKLTREEAMAADADVLIIANSPLPGEVIRANRNLKMISVGFVGVDHVDLTACAERRILVCNARDYCTVTVAELTFAHILSLLRRLPHCDKATRVSGTKEGLVGFELYEKTLGIVGTGAIGCRVAEVARAFGCRVLGYARHENPRALACGVEYRSLDTLLEQSDIVCLHLPLTPETRGLIGEKELQRMKPSAILINMARGAVVDNRALAEALQNNRIAGAGLDVFDVEPPLPENDPLLTAPNTILTPHVGFATAESMDRRVEIVFRNISAWLEGKPQNRMS